MKIYKLKLTPKAPFNEANFLTDLLFTSESTAQDALVYALCEILQEFFLKSHSSNESDKVIVNEFLDELKRTSTILDINKALESLIKTGFFQDRGNTFFNTFPYYLFLATKQPYEAPDQRKLEYTKLLATWTLVECETDVMPNVEEKMAQINKQTTQFSY